MPRPMPDPSDPLPPFKCRETGTCRAVVTGADADEIVDVYAGHLTRAHNHFNTAAAAEKAGSVMRPLVEGVVAKRVEAAARRAERERAREGDAVDTTVVSTVDTVRDF